MSEVEKLERHKKKVTLNEMNLEALLKREAQMKTENRQGKFEFSQLIIDVTKQWEPCFT